MAVLNGYTDGGQINFTHLYAKEMHKQRRENNLKVSSIQVNMKIYFELFFFCQFPLPLLMFCMEII